MKLKHKIKIENETFFLELDQISKNGTECVSTDAQIKAQQELGLKLVKERRTLEQVSPELINFLFNTSGISVVDLAKYLSMTPSDLASWRRGEKTPDPGGWLALRILLIDLFENDTITIEVLKDNYASAA